MNIIRWVWRILMGVKNILVLLFLLLFFGTLYAMLHAIPSPVVPSAGALLVELDGTIVEQPAAASPAALLSGTADGMAQEIFFCLRAAQCGLGGFKRRARLRPCPPRAARLARIDAAKLVQQHPMPARVQQATVIMLAVQFDQNIGQIAQHLARNPTVIHKGCLSSIGGIDPAQDQFIPCADPCSGQHIPCGMALGQIENGSDFTLCRPRADQFGAPAPTQHKAQGIQQDRLARPGFPGEHAKATGEIKVKRLDQHDVADGKSIQHVHAVF